MNALFKDVHYSIRTFVKSPGFAVTALVALALGIGATTAIFSIVNTVLLRPLPIFESNRFVILMTTGVSETGERISDSDASPAKFEHWRAQSNVIQDVSAFLPGVMNYTGGEMAEQLRSMQASMDFFHCWRIPVVQGRTFALEETLPNGPRVALITEDLWRRRFASDSQIIGKANFVKRRPVFGDRNSRGQPGLT